MPPKSPETAIFSDGRSPGNRNRGNIRMRFATQTSLA